MTDTSLGIAAARYRLDADCLDRAWRLEGCALIIFDRAHHRRIEAPPPHATASSRSTLMVSTGTPG